MLSRKIIWFTRITILIVTLIFLFLGYSWGFVRDDILKMDMLFTLALMGGNCFFFFFQFLE